MDHTFCPAISPGLQTGRSDSTPPPPSPTPTPLRPNSEAETCDGAGSDPLGSQYGPCDPKPGTCRPHAPPPVSPLPDGDFFIVHSLCKPKHRRGAAALCVPAGERTSTSAHEHERPRAEDQHPLAGTRHECGQKRADEPRRPPSSLLHGGTCTSCVVHHGRLRGSACSACARSTQKRRDKAQCALEIRFTDGGHTGERGKARISRTARMCGGRQRGRECSVQAPPGSAVGTRSRPHLEGTRHEPPQVGTCPAVGVDTPPHVREVVVTPELSICLQALETASTFGSVF